MGRDLVRKLLSYGLGPCHFTLDRPGPLDYILTKDPAPIRA